jgi:hypothetical protein
MIAAEIGPLNGREVVILEVQKLWYALRDSPDKVSNRIMRGVCEGRLADATRMITIHLQFPIKMNGAQ